MVSWLLPTRLLPAASALLLAVVAAPALAGSQLQQDLAALTCEAGTIFEGRVIAEQARWVDEGQAIATDVTFEINEILKGERRRRTVTLQFLGGEIDGVRMALNGLERPVLGEHGVYFVADDAEKLFHPLRGGSQGHFLVVEAGAQQRILTGDARPVGMVDSKARNAEGPGSSAAGIATLGADRVGDAMDLKTFKSLVIQLARTR